MLERQIDHLVYTTKTFEETIKWFEQMTGVKPSFGGYHKNHGTKNALVKIGPNAYLEILGIDDQNKMAGPPRWMGIDLIDKPQLSRWAIQSDDLSKDASILNRFNPEMGKIITGQRKKQNGEMLEWEMILPLVTPRVELAPFVINWGNSSHPTSSMQNEIELFKMRFQGRRQEAYKKLFKDLGLASEIHASPIDKITATFNTQKGQLIL